MTTKSAVRASAARPRRHRFTADEYQRMGAAGILPPDVRLELLEGEIYQMTPLGEWHNASVDSLCAWVVPRLNDRGIARVQGTFRLSPSSEPSPDLLILRFRPDFYRTTKVGPEDVLLLVEVADTSLRFDRDTKLPLYARAGIPEVWIADRAGARIQVFRDPAGDTYRMTFVAVRGESLAPLAYPDLDVPVDAILG